MIKKENTRSEVDSFIFLNSRTWTVCWEREVNSEEGNDKLRS